MNTIPVDKLGTPLGDDTITRLTPTRIHELLHVGGTCHAAPAISPACSIYDNNIVTCTLWFRTSRRRSSYSVIPALCLSYWMKMVAMIFQLRSLKVLGFSSTFKEALSDRYSGNLMFLEIK